MSPTMIKVRRRCYSVLNPTTGGDTIIPEAEALRFPPVSWIIFVLVLPPS